MDLTLRDKLIAIAMGAKRGGEDAQNRRASARVGAKPRQMGNPG